MSRKHTKLSGEQQSEVCRFYLSGEDIATIADGIKVSRTCVRNALISHGIPRRTLSEIRKGGHLSEMTKRRISSALKGRTISEDTRRRMSEAKQGSKNYLYGKSPSEETKEKMSISHAGKRNSRYGCNPSVETRRKISEALKGKDVWNKGKAGVYSEETVKRIADSLRGRFKGDQNPHWKGGEKLWRAKLNHRRRGVGFALITNNNPYNEPIEYHHIHPALPYVVPCPARIHQMFKGKLHYTHVNMMLGILSIDLSVFCLLKIWRYEDDVQCFRH